MPSGVPTTARPEHHCTGRDPQHVAARAGLGTNVINCWPQWWSAAEELNPQQTTGGKSALVHLAPVTVCFCH